MNESGKIIATGCNDVPEFNGGLYSADSSMTSDASIEDTALMIDIRIYSNKK